MKLYSLAAFAVVGAMLSACGGGYYARPRYYRPAYVAPAYVARPAYYAQPVYAQPVYAQPRVYVNVR